MSKLSDFKVISFDVYGTLIDWESGILTALQPLLPSSQVFAYDRAQLLQIVHELERAQQAKTPAMKYHELLTTIHPKITQKLGLPSPSVEQSIAFGESIGEWPAFPDTLDALKRLSKHYKLVLLSNVDRESFASMNKGPLQGFQFDMAVTAEDRQAVETKFGFHGGQILQTAQSQYHDHHPAKKIGMKSSWIVRPGATMGNQDEVVYDWKFDTLGDMADAVDEEFGPHE